MTTPTMTTTPEQDHATGHALLQRFIRGDAVIGLMSDVDGALQEMTSALRRAANAGHADAWYDLGQCSAAVLVDNGAFSGVYDAEQPAWSPGALAIVDENEALQAALRCFFSAAQLGHRTAARAFAHWSRHAEPAVKRVAVAVLQALPDDDDDLRRGHELCQLGYVHLWLGDNVDAVQALRAAAARGNGDAIFELSIVYAQGLGVDVDAATSRSWLLQAAEREHPRALYNLGAGAASGRDSDDGAPDFVKAAGFYERAARNGNGRAAAMLAVMILQDDFEGTWDDAIKWLDVADDNGFDTVGLLDDLEIDDPR